MVRTRQAASANYQYNQAFISSSPHVHEISGKVNFLYYLLYSNFSENDENCNSNRNLQHTMCVTITVHKTKKSWTWIHNSRSQKKYTLKIVARVTNFLRKLKEECIMSADIHNSLFSRGSTPGILYGLP